VLSYRQIELDTDQLDEAISAIEVEWAKGRGDVFELDIAQP